jgi:CubicO group peptidase (beta-lactamase class C family)
MVLSHTASIKDKEDYFTLDHLNPSIYGDCVESFYEYKPGEGYNYSNMGLNLAGAILEKLSGVRFDDYVRENVIWKLGLYGGHNNDSLDMGKCALIYNKVDGQWVASEGAYRSRAEDMPSYVMGYSAPIFSPTGGVKISAQDLAKYMMMHMNYGEYNGVRIISQESAKAMQTPVRVKEDPNAAEYALCLTEMAGYVDEEKYNTPGNYPMGHTGGAYGLNSVMIWSPADNWGIVAMTNGYVPVEGKSFLKTLTKAIYNANIKK